MDALGPVSYGAAHLPGAVNIPPERVDDHTVRFHLQSPMLQFPESLGDCPFPGEPLGCAVNVFRRAQIEAGYALGLSGLQVFRYVIFLPALKIVSYNVHRAIGCDRRCEPQRILGLE